MDTFDLPNGGSTHDEQRANKAWVKALKPFCKLSDVKVESSLGNSITFGRYVHRNNGKSALVETIECPKVLVRMIIGAIDMAGSEF